MRPLLCTDLSPATNPCNDPLADLRLGRYWTPPGGQHGVALGSCRWRWVSVSCGSVCSSMATGPQAAKARLPPPTRFPDHLRSLRGTLHDAADQTCGVDGDPNH